MPSKVSVRSRPAAVPRSLEFRAIPIIPLVEALGNGEIVQAIVWIGIDAAVDHGRQNRARNRGLHPGPGVETWLRDLGALCFYVGRRAEHPAACERPGVVSGFLKGCGDLGRLRFC